MNTERYAAGRARCLRQWGGTVFISCLLPISACDRHLATERANASGDALQGSMTIQRAACGSCHVIPGVPDAEGAAGPSLDHFGQRSLIAGLLPNTPDNLSRWLRRPQTLAPGSIMPDMGLTEHQARDVAAYLDTLY